MMFIGLLSEVNILVDASDNAGFDFKGCVLELELRSNESPSHSKRIVRIAGTKSVVQVITFPTCDA